MNGEQRQIGRRAFLQNGTLFLTAATTCPSLISAAPKADAIRVGMMTDLHYADKPTNGSRHYRETLRKFEEAAEKLQQLNPTFVVELGDFIDAADSVDKELQYLTTIDAKFQALAKERHYVLGNHCVDTLTKEEFLGRVGQEKSYYSFDHDGIHFIVLDSCFRSDGEPYQRKNFKWTDANIPDAELEWLSEDLKQATSPTVVFAHQRLDVSNYYGVKNNEAVREILESSKRVLAVFQGHSHKNDLKEIGGIHYCTLVAMVEGSGDDNNAYSLMSIEQNGTIRIDGFRKQADYVWESAQ